MAHRKLTQQSLTVLAVMLGMLILIITGLGFVEAQSSVTIVKDAAPVVLGGTDVTFTIAITNTGDVTLTNVTVLDPFASDCVRTTGVLLDLDAQESISYTCVLNTTGLDDFTNTATVTATDVPTGTVVSQSDVASVEVIYPSIEIAKTPDTQTVLVGDDASFTIYVTNTGDVTLTGVTVSDPLAPGCDRLLSDLNPGLSTSYTCDHSTTSPDDFANTATVNATDVLLATPVSAFDTSEVVVLDPSIAIAKTPDMQTVALGYEASFTIYITNTGDVTLTNVTVSDTLAPACARTTGALSNLAPGGGSTSYPCVQDTTGLDDFTNTATVTATDVLLATPVNASDGASVDIIRPSIEISKTPDAQSVPSGSTASFDIVVHNAGDVSLLNITVSDPLAPDCDDGPFSLNAGQSRNYSCSSGTVTEGFINSATASGSTSGGYPATDVDAARVRLDETSTCPSGMLAYWRLDETVAFAYADYYYGYDGQCAGVCPTPVSGYINGAQDFNGISTGIDILDVPGDDSFDWGVDDSFSIELWLRTDSSSTCSGNEVALGRFGEAPWWVGCLDGGAANFYLSDTSKKAFSVSGSAITDGAWHHIAAVRDASADEIRLYVDGQEHETSASYSAGFGSSTNVNMGWFNSGSLYRFDGTLDEVAIYDAALSAGEVRQHYYKGQVGRWYCQTGTYAPVILSTPVVQATSGRLYTYDVEAVGDPVPTYTLNIYPAGMAIDPDTGLISWVPMLAQVGTHGVEVQANNSEGVYTQSYSIDVALGSVCPTDMLALWKLDEDGGANYYDFFDGHDGVCSGDCPVPAAGRINGAQTFTSTTGIDVPAHTDFDWGADDSFSVEFWAWAGGAGACTGNEVVVGRDDPSTPVHWWVGCWNGGQSTFYLVEADGTSAVVQGAFLNIGGWHHVVAVRDASADEIRIYVDTVEATSAATFDQGFGSSAEINIGWLGVGGGYHFEGTVDEVALYDRVLTEPEIQQHHQEGLAGGPGYCHSPDIAIAKSASLEHVYVGTGVTYMYTVTNPGDAPLQITGPSDDKCSSVIYVGGDDGHAGWLDPTETWTYQCSMAVSVDITNTVGVAGVCSLGGTVNDQDTAFVDVISPQIALSKLADPSTVSIGDPITYTYRVTNPGDDPLSSIDLQDPECSLITGPTGDDNFNGKLDLVETWVYTCQTTFSAPEEAIVTGTDSAGGTVSDTAAASTEVVYPIYLPVIARNLPPP
jgi:uncharacterized repeat protein (TIGR01451 family)